MRMVNMHQAKSSLSQLVEAALAGEEVVIARDGEPIVRLIAIDATEEASLRPIGLGRSDNPMIINSELELLSATNPDLFEEDPNDPLNWP